MRIPALTFCLLFSLILNSQNKERPTIEIQISCGFAAVTSINISNYQGLIRSKNYSAIKSNLFNENKFNKLLSAIALKELQLKNRITLTTEEQLQMKAIAKLNTRYSLCFTCTSHYEGKINDLFNKKDNAAYSFINSILFEKF